MLLPNIFLVAGCATVGEPTGKWEYKLERITDTLSIEGGKGIVHHKERLAAAKTTKMSRSGRTLIDVDPIVTPGRHTADLMADEQGCILISRRPAKFAGE